MMHNKPNHSGGAMKRTLSKPLLAVFSALIMSAAAWAASINPPTTPQTSPAMNDKEKGEPEARARLVARGH
jgi:hypothetical protein